jgi:membrane-associated phospholipid phosphatase
VEPAWRRLRALWPGLTILAPAPFLLHGAWSLSRGAFRWENGAMILVVCALFVGGARAKKLLLGAYPLGVVGLLYTSMKTVENVGVSPSRVHLCDLRSAELAVFGITAGGQRMTLQDWWQGHSAPALDVLCAVPYGTFLFAIVACAVWLYFRDYPRMQRFGWCYLAINVAGFVTYHLYPAAPPWYFHTHGCVVDIAAHATEGPNLARVDAWLGVPYFAGMYGRASDVFGAMPSLHVSYALLIALLAWPVARAPGRVASAAFFAVMCFGAVYLDHHWVIDVVAGVVYCLLVVAASELIVRRRATRVAKVSVDSGCATSSMRRPATRST